MPLTYIYAKLCIAFEKPVSVHHFLMLRFSKIGQNTTLIFDRLAKNGSGDDANDDKLLQRYQRLTHFRETLLPVVSVSSLQTSNMSCAGTDPK